MPKAFISYRQVNDTQRERVRTFAERLRECVGELVLDQFYLDEHPGGPPDGWPKWSSDQAIGVEKVLIVGSESWFLCFDGKQPPGTGLGAACEAHELRQRIYDLAGVNEKIRVVLFDDADAAHISFHLKRYHRFHADRDFNSIVQWLGGTPPKGKQLSTSIPNNLPSLQPFFGREKELCDIARALDPASRTWGTLIGGDGGKGKTSLAVRAAYECPPGDFDRIVFVSLKQKEQDDNKIRMLDGFALSSWMQMLNEIARVLNLPEVAKASENERARILRDELNGRRILLLLDNLETLTDPEQDQLFTFLEYLPSDCKALLTSRIFAGNRLQAIDLPKLDQASALQMLAEIAEHNPPFAKSSEADRIRLYEQTQGNALLLRWVAGQVGIAHCTSIGDALDHLRACPVGNDPLAFIFDSIVQSLGDPEVKLLASLTWPTQPIPFEAIAEIGNVPFGDAQRILKFLTNRTLVVPDQEERKYTLVPMVAEFLRKHRPEIVRETGTRLEQRAFELIKLHGYNNHERFPALEIAWPTIAPTMPLFLDGPNSRLQIVCAAIMQFFNFTGRYDEALSLLPHAETKSVEAGDYVDAGWRAFDSGWVHKMRGEADAVLSCAERASEYWAKATVGARELAVAIQLRGYGHVLKGDWPASISAFRESLILHQSVLAESTDVVITLNALAGAEKKSDNFVAADLNYREALRIARAISYSEGVAFITGNLAVLALDRKDWTGAEMLSREALQLSEKVGRQDLIANNCDRLAMALIRQEEAGNALPYALRALEIHTKLRLPALASVQSTLRECELILEANPSEPPQ